MADGTSTSSASPPAGASTLGQDLLNVPFGEMVQNLGLAIAHAQLELDRTGVRIAQLMAGYDEGADGTMAPSDDLKVPLGTDDSGKARLYNLLELGFTPTFYQFVDTIIEVKISISISQTDETVNRQRERQGNQGAFARFFSKNPVKTSSVDAKFSSKYQYSAEGSSLLRTKLVPIPPPAILEERIRAMMAEDKARAANSSTSGAADDSTSQGSGS